MAEAGLADLKTVYLIHGSEELLLHRALRRLKDRLAAEADLDYNYTAFQGESALAEDVVAAANTLPFMSERRLVVVHDVDRMPAAQQQGIAAYAEDPAPHTTLVLTATKTDKRSRLYKAVSAMGGAAEYSAPKRGEYPGWVTELFRERGKQIGLDASETLVRAVGRDLRRLAIEVDKVCAFVASAATVTREDVEAVMSTTAPTSVFDFLDALGSRDCRQALRLLADLLGEGEQVLGVHGMALRHVRNLLSVRSLLDRGMRTPEIGKEIGLQEWQARNLVRQADHFGVEELVNALRAAAEAEGKMKTSQESRLVFERWVLSVCGSAG